jgi:hypothetical protein
MVRASVVVGQFKTLKIAALSKNREKLEDKNCSGSQESIY